MTALSGRQPDSREARLARLVSLIDQVDTVGRTEEVLIRVVDAWPGLAMSTTAAGRTVAVSDAWTALLGFSAQELQSMSWRDIVFLEDQEKVDREVSCMVSGQPCHEFRSRVVDANGKQVLLQWSASPYSGRHVPNLALAEVIEDE